MKKGKLLSEDCYEKSVQDIIDSSKSVHKLSKQDIKEIGEELSGPHLIFDNMAITDNRIIALDDKSTMNGALTNIKFSDVAWIYIGESGGVGTANLARVVSIITNDIKTAKKAAKVVMASEFASGLIDALLVGVSRTEFHTVMIIFSGDREAIIACDSKGRLSGSNYNVRNPFTGKFKCGKDFQQLINVISERCPDVAMGAEYEDDYRRMVGAELPSSDAWCDEVPDEDEF